MRKKGRDKSRGERSERKDGESRMRDRGREGDSERREMSETD